MEKYKNILVFGLGISGISTISVLSKYKKNFVVVDNKEKEELSKELAELTSRGIKINLYNEDINLDSFDLIVKSPGIPPNNELLKRAKSRKIPIITDLELTYLIRKTSNIITITGSNGKTTSCTLLEEILRVSKISSKLAGNIGYGLLETMDTLKEDEYFIIEASSFQLENIEEFSSKISVILNISEDHLDWHGSFENYKKAKFNILKNQSKKDFAVLNYDDKNIRDYGEKVKGQAIWFSKNTQLDEGVFIKNGQININVGPDKLILPEVLSTINKENILAVVSIAYIMGLDLNKVVEVINSFKGLPHRKEYVARINGLEFYNDSKGTNVDATIGAIDSIQGNIILILGGYDKNSDYYKLANHIKSKVNKVVLIGETRFKLEKSLINVGFENYTLAENMEDAVKKAIKNEENGKILLSPACASWGMYKNFEERGDHFKEIVGELKVTFNEEN